ncbi:holin [Pseudonocardia sp. T1-2H]|uniref:holin n=1 Tax=Pseudonocardia sp. T1-2H TaxID=3128899 RepID=UPI0040549810
MGKCAIVRTARGWWPVVLSAYLKTGGTHSRLGGGLRRELWCFARSLFTRNGLLSALWASALSTAGMAVLLSLLTSLVSEPIGQRQTPSVAAGACVEPWGTGVSACSRHSYSSRGSIQTGSRARRRLTPSACSASGRSSSVWICWGRGPTCSALSEKVSSFTPVAEQGRDG